MLEEIMLAIPNNSYKYDKFIKALNIAGIPCELIKEDSGYNLKIQYDIEELKLNKSRRAGRKNVEPNFIYTYGDIIKMHNEDHKTYEQIMEEIGLKPATFYRRLKMHKGKNNEDNRLF